jgi:hypothetical protein
METPFETSPSLSEEEIQRCKEMLLSMVSSDAGLEALRIMVGKGMQPPNQEGLYEVIAPDGTLAKVVDGRISFEDLQGLIRADVYRILRPTYLRMIEAGRGNEEITKETFPKMLELKAGYRLVRLPTPK